MKWYYRGFLIFIVFIVLILAGAVSEGFTTVLAVFLLIQYIELRLDRLSTQQ